MHRQRFDSQAGQRALAAFIDDWGRFRTAVDALLAGAAREGT